MNTGKSIKDTHGNLSHNRTPSKGNSCIFVTLRLRMVSTITMQWVDYAISKDA